MCGSPVSAYPRGLSATTYSSNVVSAEGCCDLSSLPGELRFTGLCQIF